MSKSQYYQYFVEGEDEKKLVNTLKSDLELILPGKVQVFNVAQDMLTKLRIGNLKTGTKVVLIFDTDAGNLSVLKDNIAFLNKASAVSEVITIPQVYNLEDELIRACNIKQIKELLGSKSAKEYKHDLIKAKNLAQKLKDHQFDLEKFWCSRDDNIYKEIENRANKIKK